MSHICNNRSVVLYCSVPKCGYSLNFYSLHDNKPVYKFFEICIQACLCTSLFCFLLYQLSLWWVKYRAQPEAINS